MQRNSVEMVNDGLQPVCGETVDKIRDVLRSESDGETYLSLQDNIGGMCTAVGDNRFTEIYGVV